MGARPLALPRTHAATLALLAPRHKLAALH